MSWLGLPVVEWYKNINLYDIRLNHAHITASTIRSEVGVYSVEDDCIECPYKLIAALNASEIEWQADTTLTTTWRIITGHHLYINRNNINGLVCQLRPSIREFGVYKLDVGTCNLEEEVPPVNTYLPLILFLLVFVNSGIIYTLIKMALDYSKRELCPKESACLDAKQIEPDSQRGLFFFRGILMSLLLFWTSGAGGYTTLTRSVGHITISECIYLAYIWSIGFRIPYTVTSAFSKGDSQCRVFMDILKRSLILIITGVMISATINKRVNNAIELWCPLQKAGLAYFAAATAYALTSKKINTISENIFIKMMANAFATIWCWIIGIFFFSTTLIAMSVVISFNVHPAPYFSATKLEDSSDVISRVTSIRPDHMRDYVNRIFLSDNNFVYMSSYYGFSKGLLGILSSILQCLIGLKAGIVYLQYKDHADRIKLWCLWGTVFLIFSVALVLLSFTKFNLWPISTIFLISSLSFYVCSCIYISSEKSNIFTNVAVQSCGATSIVILCGHLVFSKSVPFSWDIVFKNHLLYLLQNAWIVTLWLLIAKFVGKRGIRSSV